ncbi:hypothetical protein BDB00DRAFT_868324 [Zychaea mexicana]|uniref:uncharacterized protein n=1 Tax=Zychaea mexicana TaxID=64656 RepID=UPI0022FF061F|nr:uncharacterized protein BDB00DRAFT_868324 [Zychaea mexicana]KAI9497718.1 hypothetical protein BDB00DRAFT_868324 [Zychaea mexicana]
MGREPSTASSPMSPLTPTKTEDLSGFLFPGEDEPTKKQQRRRPRSFQDKPDSNSNNNNISNSSNSGCKSTSSVEIRRQIHIQSEQKRRAQIKDGFEELRNQLPACLNKKMSKVALLHRTVQHIQHLKNTQVSILAELERLVRENEELRKFQGSMTLQQDPSTLYAVTTDAAAVGAHPLHHHQPPPTHQPHPHPHSISNTTNVITAASQYSQSQPSLSLSSSTSSSATTTTSMGAQLYRDS